MLYEPFETEISQRNLGSVLEAVTRPPCLLGGWAVFQTVETNFSRIHGRSYVGSRDIDLGFHLDREASVEQLKKSDFALAISALEKQGFELIAFRFVKHFDIETQRELTAEEARRKPAYETFELYVDPVVDQIPKMTVSLFGFTPIDEPLLSHVFKREQAREVEVLDKLVLIPFVHILLATKLRSVLNRDKQHKRIKDVADIYALAWYGGSNIEEVRGQLDSILSANERKNTIGRISDGDMKLAAEATGVGEVEVRSVFRELGK